MAELLDCLPLSAVRQAIQLGIDKAHDKCHERAVARNKNVFACLLNWCNSKANQTLKGQQAHANQAFKEAIKHMKVVLQCMKDCTNNEASNYYTETQLSEIHNDFRKAYDCAQGCLSNSLISVECRTTALQIVLAWFYARYDNWPSLWLESIKDHFGDTVCRKVLAKERKKDKRKQKEQDKSRNNSGAAASPSPPPVEHISNMGVLLPMSDSVYSFESDVSDQRPSFKPTEYVNLKLYEEGKKETIKHVLGLIYLTVKSHLHSNYDKIQTLNNYVLELAPYLAHNGEGTMQLIHYAALNGDLTAIQQLIDSKTKPSVQLLIEACDHEDNRPLHHAAVNGDPEVIQCLLANGANVASVNRQGMTALDMAARFTHLEAFKKLLVEASRVGDAFESILWCNAIGSAGHGGSVQIMELLLNTKDDPMGFNAPYSIAIKQAVRNGHIDMLKYLVDERSAVLDEPEFEEEDYCFHTAAAHGRIDVLSYLIDDQELDLSWVSRIDEWHAVHYAAGGGQVEMLKHLINDRKCDINQRTASGLHCAHVAAQKGRVSVMKFLFDEIGIDVNIVVEGSYKRCVHLAAGKGMLEALQYLVEEKKADMGLGTEPGAKHCVHNAASHGQLHVLNYLINKKGVPCDLRTEDGKHCAHWAAANGHIHIIQYLIEKLGVAVDVTDKQNMQMAHIAAHNGQLETLKWLCDDKEGLSFDVDIRAHNHVHCVHLAAENGHVDIVEYMIVQKSVSAEVTDENGLRMAEYAARNGQLSMLKWLFTKSNCVTDEVLTRCAHFTARNGHIDVLKYLWHKCGVDRNAVDAVGNTCLHQAAANGHLKCVKEMCKENALDVNRLNHNGKHALNIAHEQQLSEVVTFLLSLESVSNEVKQNYNAVSDGSNAPRCGLL